MDALTIHPKNKKQFIALKAIFEEMGIPFEKTTSGRADSLYSDEFEAKMQRAEADKKAGRSKAIKTADLWK